MRLYPYILLFIACSIVSCNRNTWNAKARGIIKEQGMTSYQYGTHTIQEGEKVCVLKSSTIDLNQYLNKKVTVKGSKVEGYPLENGPELIEVMKVE